MIRKDVSDKSAELLSIILDLAMIVKQPVKTTLQFLYEYINFLLYVFVADTQTSSKHYKLLSICVTHYENMNFKIQCVVGISVTRCTPQRHIKIIFIIAVLPKHKVAIF